MFVIFWKSKYSAFNIKMDILKAEIAKKRKQLEEKQLLVCNAYNHYGNEYEVFLRKQLLQ